MLRHRSTLSFHRRTRVGRAFLLLAALGCPLRAELKVEPAAVEFGRSRQEQTLKATVKLTNASSKPLSIVHVSSGCSCTVATPERREIAAGQSTNLEVSFETRSYQGDVHRSVLIQTSDGDVTIPVSAVVSQYDDWMPNVSMVILKPSNKGEETTVDFTLGYTGKTVADIVEASASVPWLTVRVVERTPGFFKLQATKAANAPAGNHQPTITLKTSDAHEPQLTFAVFAQVYSTLRITPNPLLMPTVKVGKEAVIPASLAGWEAKEDPRFELDGGKAALRERDRSDVSLVISAVPDKLGTTTRLLRIYAGQSLEAEIPVILRAED